MGRSRENLLRRIKRKFEDLSSFSANSTSEVKYKCHKNISESISDYFMTNATDDLTSDECSDHTPFEKLMTRDVHWFSMSSFKKGLTNIIGEILLNIAAHHEKTVQTFATILIKISCMVFQWNNSSESLVHATLFLLLLRDLLLLHPAPPLTGNKGCDNKLLQTLQSALLYEMKLTKKSPPNVVETRVFMIFATLKTVILARPSFPVTETLVSLFYFASQMKNLPISSGETKSTSSQHISFRLQKLFVNDDDNSSDRKPYSRMSQQNSLDITSEYHISDHHSCASSDIVISSSFVGVENNCNAKSCGKEKKLHRSGTGASASLEKWLPKDLQSWIVIRRHPFASSSLPSILSRLLRGWALDSYDTGRTLFEHMDRSFAPLLHTLLGAQKKKNVLVARDRDGGENEFINGEGINHTAGAGPGWVHSAVQVVVVSVMQSPVLYMHSLLTQTCRAISYYYEWNFAIDPAREEFFVLFRADRKKKQNYKKKDKAKAKDIRETCDEPQQQEEHNVTCTTPEEAVSGLKLSCHFLSTFISHFTCVSDKDTVHGIIFLSNLIDNSLALMKQEDFASASPPTSFHLLQSCTQILISYLAYILIHKYHVVQSEIFNLRNVLLRNSLMMLFEDSLATEVVEKGPMLGAVGSSCIRSSNSESDCCCSKKCIDLTHPLLASYLCTVTMPRLGISCSCTPLHTSQFGSISGAKDWFEHQVKWQERSFSTADLFSLDLSHLWSWERASSTSIPRNSIPDSLGMVDGFPIQQWPSRTDGGSAVPNIHVFFRSGNDMKEASGSFILQSALSLLDTEGTEDYCPVVEEDQRRRVAAADRVFAFDICVVIMDYVSVKRVCRLACVNKQFALAAACPLVWMRKYMNRFGVPLFDAKPPAPPFTKRKVDKTKKGQNELVEVVAEVSSHVQGQQSQQELLCRHCYPPPPHTESTTSLTSARIQCNIKPTTCCDRLAKQHNWLYLFRSMALLGKSLKLQQLKRKKSNSKDIPRICSVIGCVFTYRTEKQKEVHFSKQHHIKLP